ncbi:uncharacterized protein LOC122008587 [Zingiber officinale]|uniref:uncharacterized protein LOC122008587 n=1 Tax=Zingiber officinale TaxID=94328 RepID=UPI001C4BF079|nr:uncharacterized protein LOC122008587 [Zingiber officinale]
MKRGFRNFCHGVNSTSTLKQKAEADMSCAAASSVVGSYMEESHAAGSPMTLEQMILELDMEEKATRRDGVDEFGELPRRMSCVNNSDILRSAQSALSQYPRFSLDGRDAMCRSSFRNLRARPSDFEGGRRIGPCYGKFLGASCRPSYQLDLERNLCLPPTVAGESVVWCKPGVVAKLMGLDALPVPVGGCNGRTSRQTVSTASACRKHCLRRNAKQELERERLHLGLGHGCMGRVESSGSCPAAGNQYRLMNPISVDHGRSMEDHKFGHAR